MIWFPKVGRAIDSEDKAQANLLSLVKWPVVLALTAICVWYFSDACVWPYFERIGTHGGLTPGQVGASLALATIGGLLGGGTAAFLGTRKGRVLPIALGTLGMMISYSMMLIHISLPMFVTATFINGFCATLMTAYYMGIFSESDPSGRIAAIGNVMLSAGIMIGPGVGSLLVGDGIYSQVLLIAFGGVFLSLFLVLPSAAKASSLET
jgi:predicted MFS family arabinose efflux permease